MVRQNDVLLIEHYNIFYKYRSQISYSLSLCFLFAADIWTNLWSFWRHWYSNFGNWDSVWFRRRHDQWSYWIFWRRWRLYEWSYWKCRWLAWFSTLVWRACKVRCGTLSHLLHPRRKNRWGMRCVLAWCRGGMFWLWVSWIGYGFLLGSDLSELL